MGVDAKMFVRSYIKFTSLDITHLAADMAEAFGANKFWISKDSDYKHHALQLIDVYTQDGDDIVPNPGETFIEGRATMSTALKRIRDRYPDRGFRFMYLPYDGRIDGMTHRME